MKRITYSKFFLTGTLKGLRVRCQFDVPADVCVARELELMAVTEFNPGSDLITGAKYWIYNVGSFDVEVAA
jgi:hypothetical protein